jgi:hypothetical protein
MRVPGDYRWPNAAKNDAPGQRVPGPETRAPLVLAPTPRFPGDGAFTYGGRQRGSPASTRSTGAAA